MGFQYVETLPNATMHGGLYFTDTAGNPFALCSVQRSEARQLPGGNAEHGDSTPFETAVRECQGETGIQFAGEPSLRLTHFLPPEGTWPRAKVGFVFDGGVLTGDVLAGITLDPAEHDMWPVQPLDAAERP